ncbi:PREDICTED: uncharacterized protein LOC109205718 [Nicotiana attenuata]|uniref:uncharacterized protein LOC109205718 n=1 Tax=Nicotiana attenuata TaxID=49451 RepID=UPI0009053776|nr:PREDICTED: uncharacterized protein LOC109205718 [Nicotiana attenuata]
MKQLSANVVRVVRYTWVANVVPMTKKDGKTRVCVDDRDMNKASPTDNFPLPNIHILVDNCAKNEIESFVDCYVGYHQIQMDEDDAEKIAFTTPWEFDIVYVTHTTIKAQDLAYYLAENPVDDVYKPLSMYFLDEEVNSIEKVVPDDIHAWKTYFDGAINIKGAEIEAILI